jgi:hypothetical protein
MDNYNRQLLALNDDQLERFTREWIARKAEKYVECTSFRGSGDMGRDVVGFLSPDRHEGEWDNYQCKQYATTLPTHVGIREIAKILYFAFHEHFTPPRKYIFVAPRGVNRHLEGLIFNPSRFQERLIHEWDKHAAEKIQQGRRIALDGALADFIRAYDFSRIERVTVDDMLVDPDIQPVLAKWFGADLGAAPLGEVPETIREEELPYIKQLVGAYGERDGRAYETHAEIEGHEQHWPHLSLQRERYYHADAFKRFYRDNTSAEALDVLDDDVYHGVIDACHSNHVDALACVEAVMKQAAAISISGPLSAHARVPVKQGICHHLANMHRLIWRR